MVKAKPGDTAESLIKRFTRKVFDEGIIDEVKKRKFYQKPSEIKKEREKEIKKRIRRQR